MMQHVLVSKGVENIMQGVDVCQSSMDVESIEDVANSSTSAGVICNTNAAIAPAGVCAVLSTPEKFIGIVCKELASEIMQEDDNMNFLLAGIKDLKEQLISTRELIPNHSLVQTVLDALPELYQTFASTSRLVIENGPDAVRVDSQSFNDKERPHGSREPKIFKVNDDHHVDNVGKVISKDVEISIENSYLLGDNLLISEGNSASYNEEIELGRDDAQVDKAISMGESQVKCSPNGENEGLPPSFPPSISITLYGVSMEISIEYLGYVIGSCVSRLGVDLFGDLVDDFSEMEWLLRWLFIDLDLEIHQGDYRRYLISLIECLSDDEGEESLLGSEDSGQVSMSDYELEIDCVALDDEEEIDEGVLLGLPRGLYRMLFPRDQGIVLYRQAQPYGNLQPVLAFGLANAPAHVRHILK
ncbi:hypothetical protein L7F22_024694 [Adiantum nelumboides]|nr:hypothetical protein [Adiantum nelumboides]